VGQGGVGVCSNPHSSTRRSRNLTGRKSRESEGQADGVDVRFCRDDQGPGRKEAGEQSVGGRGVVVRQI
jgi:hypothetical protein